PSKIASEGNGAVEARLMFDKGASMGVIEAATRRVMRAFQGLIKDLRSEVAMKRYNAKLKMAQILGVIYSRLKIELTVEVKALGEIKPSNRTGNGRRNRPKRDIYVSQNNEVGLDEAGGCSASGPGSSASE